MQLTIQKVYADHALAHPPSRQSFLSSCRNSRDKVEKKRAEKKHHFQLEAHRNSLQGDNWLL